MKKSLSNKKCKLHKNVVEHSNTGLSMVSAIFVMSIGIKPNHIFISVVNDIFIIPMFQAAKRVIWFYAGKLIFILVI